MFIVTEFISGLLPTAPIKIPGEINRYLILQRMCHLPPVGKQAFLRTFLSPVRKGAESNSQF